MGPKVYNWKQRRERVVLESGSVGGHNKEMVAQMVKTKICLQCRRAGFHPRVGKIAWRREWLLTAVFLPGEFHGQRSLVGYSPWGHKESDKTEPLPLFTFSGDYSAT